MARSLIYMARLHLALEAAVGQAGSVSFSLFLQHRRK